VRHAVGVGNGLDALYLALRALSVGPGDEVVVPAHTFIATWIAIVRCGAVPVPVEPDPRTALVTLEDVRARLGPRTRAVVAVHLYGLVDGARQLAALCEEHGEPLVEDAAQAHGARAGGVHAGAFGAMGCFSFYPTKNLGALGDAGMVITQNDEWAAALRAGRNYGSRARYQHESEGINSRLDEVQAALLRVRLRRLDQEVARRRHLAGIYLDRLADVEGIELPSPGEAGSHAWHLFVVQAARRESLQRHLASNGIETLIHYPFPVYRFAPFRMFAPPGESIGDRLTSRILSLPLQPYMSDDEVHQVCDAVVAAGFEQRRASSGGADGA
jgi:dTDP-4-amino-4,6-dideoxygalactose transaminase